MRGAYCLFGITLSQEFPTFPQVSQYVALWDSALDFRLQEMNLLLIERSHRIRGRFRR